MRYPLDDQAILDISRDLVLHQTAQNQLIQKLTSLLQISFDRADQDEDEEWYAEVGSILKDLAKRRIDFENHRFNQNNGYDVANNSPYPAEKHEQIPKIDLAKETQLNTIEKGFGEEMTESEIAALLDEPVKPKKKKEKTKKLSKMTLEEIEGLERAQDNSNDIYKVSARIKNLARGAVKANLTAQGDMVCNTFTHLIKSFYDFAETIPDKEIKIRLIEMTRKQEEQPANLISALGAGVKAPK